MYAFRTLPIKDCRVQAFHTREAFWRHFAQNYPQTNFQLMEVTFVGDRFRVERKRFCTNLPLFERIEVVAAFFSLQPERCLLKKLTHNRMDRDVLTLVHLAATASLSPRCTLATLTQYLQADDEAVREALCSLGRRGLIRRVQNFFYIPQISSPSFLYPSLPTY